MSRSPPHNSASRSCFGRIIDALTGGQKGGELAFTTLLPLLLAWAAFGLFSIICGAVVALYANQALASATATPY